MKINLTGIYVTDQDRALDFYTNVLRFRKKFDVPYGDARWLTVVSPAEPDGVQLVLEPGGSKIAREYQHAMLDAGIPVQSFATDDLHAEYERMRDLGVQFIMEPTREGPVTYTVFDDTCGNLIALHQED
nr:VOC family protein [Nocardiopsis gilva]